MRPERSSQLAGLAVGMTQIEVMLPSQFFGPRSQQPPELRLMIAVLHDAIDCLEKHRAARGAQERELLRETKQWFLAEEREWPYAFESICGVLDLDPSAVRQRLGVKPRSVSAESRPVRPEAPTRADDGDETGAAEPRARRLAAAYGVAHGPMTSIFERPAEESPACRPTTARAGRAQKRHV